MSSIHEITRASYEQTAVEFAKKVEELAPIHSIDRLCEWLPARAKLLDIGCGSGRDAALFTERGVSVTGIDSCAKMLEIAQTKAPKADFHLMSMGELSFPAETFDAVWINCALIHLPKKELPSLLIKIHSLLKEPGYLYITLKKGEGEGLAPDERYEGVSKYCALYEEEEIRGVVGATPFKLIELAHIEKTSAYQTHDCLRLFCQK